MNLDVSYKIIKHTNIRENLWFQGLDKEFFNLTPNVQLVEGKIDTSDSIIIKLVFLQKILLKDKNTSYTWGKDLQITYLTKDSYLEYTKNSQN